MYRCSLHFVDCKWELTTCASKHSLVYAIDEIQISDQKWGCARDKQSKAEPEFNVLISIWGLCWCNFFDFGHFFGPFGKRRNSAYCSADFLGQVVMVDRHTKRSRGFGFIRFAHGRHGSAAAQALGEVGGGFQ